MNNTISISERKRKQLIRWMKKDQDIIDLVDAISIAGSMTDHSVQFRRWKYNLCEIESTDVKSKFCYPCRGFVWQAEFHKGPMYLVFNIVYENQIISEINIEMMDFSIRDSGYSYCFKNLNKQKIEKIKNVFMRWL